MEGRLVFRIHGLLLCALMLLIAFLAPAARATIITLDFSGTVDDPVDYSGLGYVPSGIQDGSSFVGTVTFNNDAVARSTDATDAYYSGTDLDMTVNITIVGQYTYSLTTPSSSDEIDLEGSSFGLYKRGPTVYTSFSPNPPFSHLDLGLQTDTDVLSDLQASDLSVGTTPLAGVSDQQTPDAGYYYVAAQLDSVSAVPEPATATLMLLASLILLLRRRRAYLA